MPLLTSPCPSISTQPLPPCQARNVGDSDLFTQVSHLGFSGRLGGRGTGGVWCWAHLERIPFFRRRPRYWVWEVFDFMLYWYCYNLIGFLCFTGLAAAIASLSLPLWITERSLIKGASPRWQQTVSKHKSVFSDFMGFAFKLGFPLTSMLMLERCP